MIHYVWHDADGVIGCYSLGAVAWDGDPLNNPMPGTFAANCRDYAMDDLDMIGGVAISCGCPIGDYGCPHPQDSMNDQYVDVGGAGITDKAALTVKFDGVAVSNDGSPLPSAPGSTVSLRLEASVPDGTQVTLRRTGKPVCLSDPTLTFTGGQTESVDLTAPSQGETGGLTGVSKLVRRVRANLLGWSA